MTTTTSAGRTPATAAQAPRPAHSPSSPTPSGSSRSPLSLPTLGLLAVTAAWGSTFFLLKDVVTRVPVADFLALRFLVAAAAVTLLAPRALGRLSADERRYGVLLGLVYGVGQVLQTTGLQTTSASVSGFLTGMYVVFTPVLGAVLLRHRTTPVTWAAVSLATVGLGVLSLQGFAVGTGEALTVLSAVLYALHIVGLGLWSREGSALGLTIVQLWVVAAVCLVAGIPGGLTLPTRGYDWGVLVFMALVAGAAALVVQTWAQARLAAARAAVIMTMEPVFAGFFAVLLGGEVLTVRVLVGGGIVLAAMYLVELGPGQRRVAADIGSVQHVGPV